MLPEALITPVTYSPVLANTATLPVPATLIAILELAVAEILLLPLDIGKLALIPVN